MDRGAKDAAKPNEPKYSPTSDYRDREMRGWKVRVHPRLLADVALADRVLGLLDAHLYQIVRVVPARGLAELREVPIWVELDDPGVQCMCYHPCPHWLKDHGYNPDKAGGVEIGNTGTFLSWTRIQPWMVLHELAHAYHHQVLGWDHAEVEAAYKQARDEKRYDEVLAYNGTTMRAYGMNDAREYFAEGTEAWFGTNDFYPFVRPELVKHDPRLAALLKKILGRIAGLASRVLEPIPEPWEVPRFSGRTGLPR